MTLWNNTDANTSVPKWIGSQFNQAPGQVSADLLYANNMTDVVVSGANVGTFGVSAGEQVAKAFDTSGANTGWGGNAAADGVPTHAGWVVRTLGTGGRAGRVTYETMVAMGSMTGDGSGDTIFPDYTINIWQHPSANTANAGAQNVFFRANATSVPDGATLNYRWHKAIPPDNNVWVALANTAPFANAYSNILNVANNITLTGNTFRCMITGTNVKTANTNSALLTVNA